jgi:hypothetical protein
MMSAVARSIDAFVLLYAFLMYCIIKSQDCDPCQKNQSLCDRAKMRVKERVRLSQKGLSVGPKETCFSSVCVYSDR